MRRLISITLALPLLLSLTACFGPPVDPDTVQESIQVIAMDTAMVISTYGKRSTAAAYASEDLIRELESQLSRTEEESAVFRLNGTGTLELGEKAEDLFPLLEAADRYCRETGGAFDITVAPVVAAWGFAGGAEYRVPGKAELQPLLALVERWGRLYEEIVADGQCMSLKDLAVTGRDLIGAGWEPGRKLGVVLQKLLELVDGTAVKVTDRTAALAPGQSIDLGGIAKGYAADRLTDLFREYEIPRAMATLGGNVLVWGNRPDGTPWRVGVQDPARPQEQNAFVGVLLLENAFAVTSGGYQRYFEESGKTYHHIIDPATGFPADSGLTSVTVVADCAGDSDLPGTMCDAFSTALFVMGEERALDFWRNWGGNPFELVLVTEDGRVAVTGGLAEKFDFDTESGYVLEVIS